MLKIDSHSHIMPRELPRWAEKFGYDGFIHLEHQQDGSANMMKGTEFFRRVKSNSWDAEERIVEYAKLGVDVQVVCTIPVLFSYWAKPADGYDIARFLNDDLIDTVQKYPKQYIGLGTLPMQDADLSIKELERLKQNGIPGVQIGSNINDLNLSEAQFFPIFEAAQQLDMAIMVHPWNMMGQQHMKKYWLPWLVGMPAETSRAICSLIFGAVLERLPQLRWMFSHAGGEFLFTLGRIEHGFNCRPDLVAIDNPVNPRSYLGKFWIDSITHDARALQYVADLVGVDKICMGSDYPFPLGDLEMGKFMESMSFTEKEKEQLFSGATLNWLNLDKNKF
jgi:aminocarboxymuconate-semialdehyde decarboxylase